MSAVDRIFDPSFLQDYWPLNKDALDYSGHGRDGTPTDLTFVEGPFNGKNIGDFNGSTSEVDLDDTVLPIGSTPRSITCFFQATDITSVKLFDYGTDTTGQRFGLGIGAGSVLEFDGSSADVSGITTIIAGQPYFTVVTWDGVSLKLYLNSVFESVGTPTLNTTLSGGAKIGTKFDGATEDFTGQIWKVKILNVALSVEEITVLHQFDSNA